MPFEGFVFHSLPERDFQQESLPLGISLPFATTPAQHFAKKMQVFTAVMCSGCDWEFIYHGQVLRAEQNKPDFVVLFLRSSQSIYDCRVVSDCVIVDSFKEVN